MVLSSLCTGYPAASLLAAFMVVLQISENASLPSRSLGLLLVPVLMYHKEQPGGPCNDLPLFRWEEEGLGGRENKV